MCPGDIKPLFKRGESSNRLSACKTPKQVLKIGNVNLRGIMDKDKKIPCGLRRHSSVYHGCHLKVHGLVIIGVLHASHRMCLNLTL
jgi:hypothetical protein